MILGLVFVLLLIVLAALLVFFPALMWAKKRGLREYGTLASNYVGEFERKWVRGGASESELLLGNSDFQSLADLSNAFQVVQGIHPVPFGKDTVIQVVAFTVIPVLPLVLTMIPREGLLKKFFETIF